MDVSCPRCKTEYEFDDARVPDAGVTVKCTSCSYVFRVKRGETQVGGPPPSAPPFPPPTQPDPLLPPSSMAGSTREWKVRQPSGNVFAFRELTTLQKWIVERKVARDDEISLSGETWKRLGNIPELASFFLVVDEAMKAAQLQAQAAGLSVVPPPSAPPLPAVSQAAPKVVSEPPPSGPAPFPVNRIPVQQRDPSSDETLREPLYAHRPTQKMGQPLPAQPPPAQQVANKVLETLREPGFSIPAAAPSKPPEPAAISDTLKRPSAPRPSAPPPRQLSVPMEQEFEPPRMQSSSAGWYVFLLAAMAVGGGAGYYFFIYSPDQQRIEEARQNEQGQAAAEAKKKAEEDARAAALADEQKRKDDEAKAAAAAKLDAGPADAGAKAAATVDAGSPGSSDAGVAAPVKHDFDWYLSQGDRLRDREKAEKALEMYGVAADMEQDRVEPTAGKGWALLDLGKHLQAEAAFQQALRQNARYAPAIMGLAETYRAMGKNDQAVQHYQKYLDVLPNGPEANVARSNIERLKSAPTPTPEPTPPP